MKKSFVLFIMLFMLLVGCNSPQESAENIQYEQIESIIGNVDTTLTVSINENAGYVCIVQKDTNKIVAKYYTENRTTAFGVYIGVLITLLFILIGYLIVND